MVVDTATAAVTAALARIDEGGTLLAERVTVDARGAGELLAPQIAAVLAGAGATPGGPAAAAARPRRPCRPGSWASARAPSPGCAPVWSRPRPWGTPSRSRSTACAPSTRSA